MSNIGPNITKIENVVIWIGKNPGNHWKRIKVSNVPNKFDENGCPFCRSSKGERKIEPNNKIY